MQKIAFIYGKECNELLEKVKKDPLSSELEFISYDGFMHKDSPYERVLVSGDLDEIKSIFARAISRGFEVALIPNSSQVSLQESFSLSKKLDENLQIALENESKEIDILYANGQIVLNWALIGDAPPLNYRTSRYSGKSFKERMQLLYDAYKKIKSMHHTKIKIRTKKSQEIETVATGVIVIEHDNKTCASKLIQDSLSSNDSKLSSLIISPNSIIEYLSFITKAIFVKNQNSILPSSVGYIKSESLYIESEVELPLQIDAQKVGTTPVEFFVKKNALKISLPKSYSEKVIQGSSDKETIKIDKLPSSSEKMSYLQKKLPFFTHASEEQYRTLFGTLRDEGKLSSTFVILMLLSTMLATIGLYLNSASVIIGAMLLAPLMQPIVAFAMGLLRRDETLTLGSLKTIAAGIGVALLSSALIAWILPFENITSEMAGRIKPSLLDMFVAIVSGIAAAYVKNNAKIAGSLAGVAIAVALVPPIATAGIGLGWGNLSMLYQAFLLFLTNFVGIVFAASLVFYIQGFAPMQRAKKGLMYALIFSSIIALPLFSSFVSMVQDAKVISALNNKTFHINSKSVVLQNVVFVHDPKSEVIKCDLLLKDTLNGREIKELKKKIEKEIDKKIDLEAVFRVRF
jgi:uncharacterized hydrophobic protein (TIGR00271 family)